MVSYQEMDRHGFMRIDADRSGKQSAQIRVDPRLMGWEVLDDVERNAAD
jgi:hypothetical protein